MLIEALMTLRLKLPDRDLRVAAGQTVNLPDELALKLLERAAGKVRAVAPPVLADLISGAKIVWESPLFGKCTGEIALPPENGWLVVRSHSVTGNLALVNVDWVHAEKRTQT
ncbi:MAG: hypothetical protein R3B95_18295 [Nitrospirales bacterium]|nr:hypothetical protein [Nitrospirales bacterium]